LALNRAFMPSHQAAISAIECWARVGRVFLFIGRRLREHANEIPHLVERFLPSSSQIAPAAELSNASAG
jgi:hypothetical protein